MKGVHVWTIYLNPKEYPGRFVARAFLIAPGTGFAPTPVDSPLVADTLEEIRALLPPGLLLYQRQQAAGSCIIEEWI